MLIDSEETLNTLQEAPTGNVRQQMASRTREDILAVATREFATLGYSGARVDDIADKTRTSKRMIYYYFGNKERLYTEVLHRAYQMIRDAEQQINVDQLEPLGALRRLAELTFDHHESHPDFIRLVSIENTHYAQHMDKSAGFSSFNDPIISLIERVLERGARLGVMRPGLDPFDIHVMISSFCFFRVANRHTVKAIFGRDLLSPDDREHHRRSLGDMVTAYVTAPTA